MQLLFSKFKKHISDLLVRPGRSIDADVRYLPLVKRLKGRYRQGETVLEVGAGDYGLTPYLPIPITGVDIPSAFTEKKSNLVTTIYAQGVHLPFEDSSFDYVFSVDMLEHVVDSDRVISINEMIRVARKGVFISVPTGSLSEDQDRLLDKRYQAIHGERFYFLKEHLDNRLPRAEDFLHLMQNNSKVASVEMLPNFQLKIREKYMLFWMRQTKMSEIILGILSYLSPLYAILHRGNCYRSLYIISFYE